MRNYLKILKDKYIIIDNKNGYWSSEELGRFSGGPLFEKTFTFYWQVYIYRWWHNIKGKIILHKEHWTYKMPLRECELSWHLYGNWIKC